MKKLCLAIIAGLVALAPCNSLGGMIPLKKPSGNTKNELAYPLQAKPKPIPIASYKVYTKTTLYSEGSVKVEKLRLFDCGGVTTSISRENKTIKAWDEDEIKKEPLF